jgi:hypothetical protein
MSADNNFVRATQKSILDILVSSRISAQEVNFEHEAALSSFFDGSSVAARMFEAEPNAITSGGVVWGDSFNGVILDSSITNISSLDELVETIENGLETGQFRSLSIYDYGDQILTLTGNSKDWSLQSGDLNFNLSGTLPTSMSGLFNFIDSLRKIPDFLGIKETTYWDNIQQTWITQKGTPLGLSDYEREVVIDTLNVYYLDKIEIIKNDDLFLSLVSDSGKTLVEWDGIPIEVTADISTGSLGDALQNLAELQDAEIEDNFFSDLVSSRISAQEVNFEHEAALSSFFDGSSVAARMFEAEPNAITSGGVVWGDSFNGVILDSSITNISSLDELVETIENGLETGQFRSLSIYDYGDQILTLTGNSKDWSLQSGDLNFNLSGTLPTSMSGLFNFIDSLRKIPDFLGIKETTYWDNIQQTWITQKGTPLGLSDYEREVVIDTLNVYYLDKIEIIKNDDLFLSLVSDSGKTLVEWDGIPIEVTADISTGSLGDALQNLAELQDAEIEDNFFSDLVSSRISAQEVNFEHEAALSSFFDGSSVAARMFEAEPNAITSGGVVWGDSFNGVILDSSITNISSLDELVETIENGLETGQFRSLSIYDYGDQILTLTGNSKDWSLQSGDLNFNLSGTLPTSMSGLFNFIDSLRKIPDFLGIKETTYWDNIQQTWITQKGTPLGLSDYEREVVIDTLNVYYLDKIEIIKNDDLFLSLVSDSGKTLVEWDGIPIEVTADISTDSLGDALQNLAELQDAEIEDNFEVLNNTPSGTVSISGTMTKGQVLTVDTSSLADADGLGALSYQWLRDGADISDATSASYTLAQADVGAAISARVSYTDDGGTAESVSSAATQAISPNSTTAPTIDLNDADGTLVAYEILNWEGLSGTAYPNSTVTLISTYDVTGGYEAYEASVSADGKWSIDQAVVGAIPPDGQFSLSVTSKDSSGTVSDPAIASLIFDLGTAGTDFAAPTINLHDADGVITPSEFTNWSGVSGTAAANSTVIMVSTDKATGAKGTLLLQADTNGDWSWSPTTDQVQSQASSYDLSVTYTDNVDKISAAATTTLAFSDGTGPVNATPTGTVSISGTTTEGQVLTVDTASLADADGLGTLSYQWLRDGADISGATSKTYTLAQADVGAAVSARVSYTDGGGTAESVSSAVTQAIVASAPTVLPFDIVLASESGGVASFEIYADASVDPGMMALVRLIWSLTMIQLIC